MSRLRWTRGGSGRREAGPPGRGSPSRGLPTVAFWLAVAVGVVLGVGVGGACVEGGPFRGREPQRALDGESGAGPGGAGPAREAPPGGAAVPPPEIGAFDPTGGGVPAGAQGGFAEPGGTAPSPGGPGGSAGAKETLRFSRPARVRGLYLNAWAAGSGRRVDSLVALARRTEINTFVIDLKDATGHLSYASRVPLAQEIGATADIRIRDLPALLRRLQDEEIYPIARIVVVQDPILARARPEMAVQDREGGAFRDAKGFYWLNPYHRGVWDYHVELAREAAELGFPEIQWDYIRFPDIPAAEGARTLYPGSEGEARHGVIGRFLAYSRERLRDLGVVVTADVFGVITTARRDVGVGQVWETILPHVDVALPMVYPSHYWAGSFGFPNPNAHPYEVVRRALEDALTRAAAVAGAGSVRPWLQDFSLGQPPYGAAEVRAQIQAVYDAGLEEWILWNAASRYTEAALEPVGGWSEEPVIRLGGELVPVSRRHTILGLPGGRDVPPRPGG